MVLKCYFFINKRSSFVWFPVYLCVSISAPVLLFMQTAFKGEMQNMSGTCCCTSFFMCLVFSDLSDSKVLFSVAATFFYHVNFQTCFSQTLTYIIGP